MDSNGLRFWMLSSKQDWLLTEPAPDQQFEGLSYCERRNRLHLRSTPDAPANPENFTKISDLLGAAPFARDPYGTYARWDPNSGHVMAGGAGASEVPIYTPPAHSDITDMALGYDGVLYLAVGGQLVFVDRHGRWDPFTFPDSGVKFKAWRLEAHPEGGVIVLDQENHQLLRIQGLPLPDLPPLPYSANVLRPCDENQDPPRISAVMNLPAQEFLVALAGNGAGTFALLSWNQNAATNDAVHLRTFTSLASFASEAIVGSVKFPYSIAWLEGNQLALLASENKKALIYDLSSTEQTLQPTGETYVLSSINPGPFAHGFLQPPNYNVGPDLFPLLPLSLNSLACSGEAQNHLRIDGGSARAVWHRMYLEASLPQRCGVVVKLAAADDPQKLNESKTPWFPHVFGDAEAPADVAQVPRGVWQRVPSEVPFHPGLLGDKPEKDRKGLFMVLVQRAGAAVRSLRGRYLGIKVELTGDGRNTPEIAALRVYGPRFSYVEHYLPELYRETTFGNDADANSDSTRPDFLERFVDIFEGPMTQMEDRVAAAYRLTNPQSTPDDNLDWLGSWVGVDPSPQPPDRRRARLVETPRLYQERGTVRGITDAIDVDTSGLCKRGAVIVLEDYRLRHTFATILGADLSIKDDPLLPGYWASSNSIVGDTLFLGDEHRKEFLALFADVLKTASEQAAVEAFFDQLAHRMTVFVHDQVETVDMQVVQRTVEREKPAHVAVSYMKASQPFLVGMASLLGINSYLAPPPPKETARVNVSAIGRHAFITHVPSLDPRLDNADAVEEFPDPIARISAPPAVPDGGNIVLDGGNSSAPSSHAITNYRWEIVSKPS
jgi:phage tail-like protein